MCSFQCLANVEACALSGNHSLGHGKVRLGTSAGATLVQWESFPQGFIQEYWLINRSLEYDEKSFAEVYKTLETFIYDDELPRTLSVPLQNFDSDIDSITFEQGLTAQVITPELYESLYLRGGQFRSENKVDCRGFRSWLLTVQVTERKIIREHLDPAPVDDKLMHTSS